MSVRKILHLLPDLARCEATVAVRRLIEHLPREQFEQAVCLVRGSQTPVGDDWQRLGVEVISLPVRRRLDLAGNARYRRWVAAWKPAVIHSWGPDVLNLGGMGNHGYRPAQAILCEPFEESGNGVFAPASRVRLVRNDAVVVVRSSELVDVYQQARLTSRPPQVVPPPAVALQRDEGARQRVREAFGLRSTDYIVLTVGRLALHKRMKDLIWAADLLKVVRDDVHLFIVGTGPHAWRLKRFCEQCEITDKVHFLGQRDDVPELLQAADLFWLGSQQPSVSSALIEAMAAGLPVVASDTRSHRGLIQPWRNGVLFPVGNRAQLARWTQQLLEQPQRRADLGRAGQQEVLARFPLDQWVRQMAALYTRPAAATVQSM